MSKVLIAEDNILKQNNIKKILKDHNISFKLVETYSDCWKEIYYEHYDYDRLILDMSMPRYKDDDKIYKFAGLDILKRLYYSKINIPTIILTGHVQFTVDKIINDIDSVINMIEKDDRISNAKVIRYDTKSTLWEKEIISFIIGKEQK